MTRICMTLSLPSALGLFLLATVAGCATLPSNSVNTNVPSDRLSSETYTSPDGGYSVTLPRLNAGAKVAEHFIGPVNHAVRFSDASGTAYRILRIDNTVEKFTVEQILNESKASELFRENRFVESDRGKELRLVVLKKEGSPLVLQIRENDVLVTRKNNLYKADSIFMHGIYMYEVSAGVTASQGQSEDALFDEARRNLEKLLKGLSFRELARLIDLPLSCETTEPVSYSGFNLRRFPGRRQSDLTHQVRLSCIRFRVEPSEYWR